MNPGPGKTWRDDQITGLQLKGRADGASWLLYYRTKTGRERRPKLGDYPTMTLKQAREAAKAMLQKVWAGEDPSLDRQQGRASAATVADLCALYMECHGSKKKSAYNDQSTIKAHVLPGLGKYDVREISRQHIEQLHAKVSLTAPVAANRTVMLLSKMFNLAEKWGMRPEFSNPCRMVDRNKEKRRRRYMTPAEAKAIDKVLYERLLNADTYPTAAVIYLLMFTGARRNEIAGRVLRVVGDELFLSDSKTGARTVQLSKWALSLIDAYGLNGKLMPSGSYVTHTWHDICEEAGVVDLHLHDLRHTFASVALSNGVSLSEIGELLGHASTQTTKRYAHLVKGRAQAATNLTANAVAGMLLGRGGQGDGTVVLGGQPEGMAPVNDLPENLRSPG